PALAAGIWLGGCLFFLIRRWKRWRHVCAVLRASRRADIEGPVPVRTSRARMEPGVFGVFRPVLLLPEGIVERLTPAQLRTILAHEFCHVRRRDNFTACVHTVVETVFWFYPL